MSIQHPIDIVIPWVDGGDPEHQKKMQSYLPKEENASKNSFKTRFHQVEEIEFSIKSILKFAPFVRNIFLVTDNQVPKFLAEPENAAIAERVQIIDHKVIFKGYEHYLPTFNSMSIESMIYRIPGLSEHYIYSNDDIFFIKPVKPEDFFSENKVVFRGQWKTFDEFIWYKRIRNSFLKAIGKPYKKNKSGYKKSQQNIAKPLGFQKKYFKFDHTPATMVKSTIADYFEEHPEKLISNIEHRFRHENHFTIQGLVSHLHILKDKAILKTDLQLTYFGSYKKPLFWYIFALRCTELNKSKLFMCLQSLDLAPSSKLKYIKKWMNRIIEA